VRDQGCPSPCVVGEGREAVHTFEAAKIPSAGVEEYPGGFPRQDGPFRKDPLPNPPPQGEGPKSTALPLRGGNPFLASFFPEGEDSDR